MSMKVIVPNAIGDAQLISTNVPETVALWSAATTYAIGDQVRLDTTHKVYASLQAANLNHNPDTDTSSPPYWKAVGPTNRWAMVDTQTSTKTTQATNVTVAVKPGLGRGLFLGGLKGTIAHASMVDENAVQVWDSGDINLDESVVTDWLQYFTGAFVQKEKVFFTDLPLYLQGVITVSITAGGDAAIGDLKQGPVAVYGGMRFGAEAEILSFSRKDTDPDTGVTTFVPKGNASTNNYTCEVDKAITKSVWASLRALDAKPAVFIGLDDSDRDMFVISGFYRNAKLVVSYPTIDLYDLQLEELN